MFASTQATNHLINDPVPKNVSKFPIHQTYLTDDAELTASNIYKFKAPEVWSSARSGKKSIAIRSVTWHPKTYYLSFNLTIHKISDGDTTTNDQRILFRRFIAPYNKTFEILEQISSEFATHTADKPYFVGFEYDNEGNLTIQAIHRTDPTVKYSICLTKNGIKRKNPSDDTSPIIESPFDEIFNQPFTENDGNQHSIITLHNVWDRNNLNFHASFVPFDNYQYFGPLGVEYQNPIIFQDPATSPIFNIWTTTNLKTHFPVLHETFIIRITFIISSDSQYRS